MQLAFLRPGHPWWAKEYWRASKVGERPTDAVEGCADEG
jgi:hypothetical protein